MKEKYKKILFAVIGIILGILLEFLLTAHALRSGKWQDCVELDLGKMVGENRIQADGCVWGGILPAALSWIIDRMIVDVLMNGKIWKTCRKWF